MQDDLNVRALVGANQPHYVLHQNKEYTFTQYLALIDELNITQYDQEEEHGVVWDVVANFLSKDQIVGERSVFN